MNINNPTTFSTPDLTLSTSNSSGTAGALRADDTILVYDTSVPTTIAYGASAAAGSAAVSARRDHTHGMAATPTAETTVVNGSRTAAAGTGDQAITGAGFAPAGVVFFSVSNNDPNAAWGFGDDANGEGSILMHGTDGNFGYNASAIGNISSGSNEMQVLLKSLDADGATLTWAKSGSGMDINWVIWFIR